MLRTRLHTCECQTAGERARKCPFHTHTHTMQVRLRGLQAEQREGGALWLVGEGAAGGSSVGLRKMNLLRGCFLPQHTSLSA